MSATLKMELSKACFVIVFVSSAILCVTALEKPDDISDEMYCLSCQIIVKELDFVLSHKPTRGMGETVTRALRKICDVHNFDKYEIDPKKVNEVCKHIRGDEGMEAVLITEYNRKHKTGKMTTYLDITRMICDTVLRACNLPEMMGDEKDGGINFDPAIEDFYVKDGKNVRVAKPVREGDQQSPSAPNQTTEQDTAQSEDNKSPVENKEQTVTKATITSTKNDVHEEL